MANKFPTNKSFQRLSSNPLDETSVSNNLQQIEDYVNNNPTAYHGQVIHIQDARDLLESDSGNNIYEDTYYINHNNEPKPICSFTHYNVGLFFEFMYDLLNGNFAAQDKLDKLKESMYDNYTYDFEEYPTGDYHTQPWVPDNYNGYQIALKMTQYCEGDSIGANNRSFSVSAPGLSYTTENITINRKGHEEYYKIITCNSLPTGIALTSGIYIEKVIHMCDTSKVNRMGGMFQDCTALTELDVSYWDVSNVYDMFCMFYGCKSLTSLDMSNWNTENVTDMMNMFYNCTSLTSLNLFHYGASNMQGTFCGCSSLTTLDISNLDTTGTYNMAGMFSDCSGLITLDVSNLNTSSVKRMSSMFAGCSSLTELDLSNFNTYWVQDMTAMFKNCTSLKSLDLSNFDTSNLTDIRQMFWNCSSLTELNLSNWDLSGFNYDSYREFSNTNNLKLSNIDMTGCSQSTINKITEVYNASR